MAWLGCHGWGVMAAHDEAGVWEAAAHLRYEMHEQVDALVRVRVRVTVRG